MIDDQAIDEIVEQFDGWKKQKLVVSLKAFDGNKYIDCRKWLPVGSDDKLRPSKGVMFASQDWPHVISMINEMLSRHNLNVKMPNE